MNVETTDFSTFEHYTQILLDSRGHVLEVPLRRGTENAAFIDQITFSFHESSITTFHRNQFFSDEEYMILLSIDLEKIFGFGITKKNDYKGRLFYNSTYHIGDINCKYGTVHFGGQNNTIAVEMTAEGCMAAKSGWEFRLYEYLSQCIRAKITRIDVAHDFLNGEYSPEQAIKDFDLGGFSWTNRTPKSETRGTDWRSNDCTGKTFYVGSRQSSKFTRIYEKGKQLGDKSSPWTRFEVEFKAHDIHIPHDVLLHPGEFLCGAYPICEKLFKARKSERIQAVIKNIELTEEKAIYYAKQQVGRLINYLQQKGFYGEDIVNKLKPDHNKLPDRLNPSRFFCEFSSFLPIHKQKAICYGDTPLIG